MYRIVTNNSKCLNRFDNEIAIEYLDGGSYMEVLLKVRDYIHLGYGLLTHPMAGSLKPNQIPYKSIVISDLKVDKEESLSFALLMENSIESCKKFLNDKATPQWTSSILEDFKDVDLTLIEGGVSRLL